MSSAEEGKKEEETRYLSSSALTERRGAKWGILDLEAGGESLRSAPASPASLSADNYPQHKP